MDQKKLKSPQSLFEVIYPFHCVSKFFGLIIYSFDGPVQDGKIIITTLDLVIFFSALLGHLTLFVLLFFKTFGDITTSVVLNKGNLTGIFFAVSLVIIIVLYQFCKRKVFKKLLTEMNEFDMKVFLHCIPQYL